MTHSYLKSFKWLSLCLLALIPCMAYASAPMTMNASPANVLMGAQFDGVTLKVDGTVPAGSDVILRFTGNPEELHLRQKGKVFNLLWMNIGKVVLKNVPKMYLVESSRPFAELGALGTSFQLENLKASIGVDNETVSNGIDVIHELLLLKEQQELYSETSAGVHLGPDTGATRSFSAEIYIPSDVVPSDYTIEAIAVQNGAIVGDMTTPVVAKLIGFPEWLSNLAFNNGLLYGVLATIIAVVCGLGIGLLFQSKGAH